MQKEKSFPSIQKFKKVKISTRTNTPRITRQEVNRTLELVNNVMYATGESDGWYPSAEMAREMSKDVIENYELIQWIVESNPNLSMQNPEACEILKNALKKISIIDKKGERNDDE